MTRLIRMVLFFVLTPAPLQMVVFVPFFPHRQGGVAIAFSLGTARLLLVNAHFPAHTDNVDGANLPIYLPKQGMFFASPAR